MDLWRWHIAQHFLRNFEVVRKDAAKRLGNPRLSAISFRTLRHFKATMEYQKTRDIHQEHLGLYSPRELSTHEYVCKVSKNIDDATTLVENGFDYVTDIDEVIPQEEVTTRLTKDGSSGL